MSIDIQPLSSYVSESVKQENKFSAAKHMYIDGHQSHEVNCQCGMRKWQMIKASVEEQSLVVDDQSTAFVA